MIKKTDTTIEVRGTKAKIMTDLTMIMRHLIESGNFTNEDIDECVRISRQTEEEVKAETLKAIKGFFEGIRDFGSDEKPEEKKADDKATQPDGEGDGDFLKKLADIVEKALKEN